MQLSDCGVQDVSKGEVEPRDTKGRAARSLRMVRRSWSYRGFFASLEPENRTSDAEVEQRGDSPVLVMHDGVTKSIFAHLIPEKEVDFPSCEKVVKMIAEDLHTSGYHRVVAVKLALDWRCGARNVCCRRPAIQRCCRKFSKRRQKDMSDR